MPVRLSGNEVRAFRMRAQLLSGERPTVIADAVARVGGLQAQSAPAARLAVRARTSGLTSADVDRAVAVERSVVRSWLMRGTLHMVAAEDVRWMGALMGPMVERGYVRRRRELGLDDALCERALESLPGVLREPDPVRQSVVVERLADAGVAVPDVPQAAVHLMILAAARGLVVRGPESGREATYATVDGWVAPSPTRERPLALAELARRYLHGHGPAGDRDFGTWSGLPADDVGEAFAAVRTEMVAVEVGGEPMLMAEPPAEPVRPPVRLLGMFDEYLLGYRDRALVVDGGDALRVQDGGIVSAVVLDGGCAVGRWRLEGSGGRRRLVVDWFDGPPRGVRVGLAGEAGDIGRFLGVEVEIAL